MPVVTPYPPAPPTISNNRITVDLFLRQPARVQRSVERLAALRFLADFIFADGPTADGGAVVYDVVTQQYLFLDDDVQQIEPGSEFPLLGYTEPEPQVAVSRKYGGEVPVTYEDVRRNRIDKLNRAMTRLRNTITRKVDTIAMAALRAAALNTHAGADWTTAATDVIADIATAASLVTRLDLGYTTDTVLLNPLQELDLLVDQDIRNALPRERTDVPIATGNLGRLMGHDFIVSNRINAGEAFVLTRGTIGSISDEVPLYARPLDDPRKETWFVHGARLPAVYVTDPLSGTRITGI